MHMKMMLRATNATTLSNQSPVLSDEPGEQKQILVLNGKNDPGVTGIGNIPLDIVSDRVDFNHPPN